MFSDLQKLQFRARFSPVQYGQYGVVPRVHLGRPRELLCARCNYSRSRQLRILISRSSMMNFLQMDFMGKMEISLDKLPIKRLDAIEENGVERFPTDVCYDDKWVSLIRRIDFAWAVEKDTKKQKVMVSSRTQNLYANICLIRHRLRWSQEKHSGMTNASVSPTLHPRQICRQLASLHELAIVDLSYNLLTGPIPEKLSNLSSLLNVSFNDVFGSIPLENIFRMMGSSAFVGNSKLCGEPLKPCADSEGIQLGFKMESKSKDKLKWVFLL